MARAGIRRQVAIHVPELESTVELRTVMSETGSTSAEISHNTPAANQVSGHIGNAIGQHWAQDSV